MDGEERDPVDDGAARGEDAAAPDPQAPPPADQDPSEEDCWEEEHPADPDAPIGEGQPCCLKCFEPFEPFQDYCRKCGWAVGQLTPYKPLESIPFNYSFVKAMWAKVFYEKTSFAMKWTCITVLILTVPVIFVLGLPFLIAEQFAKRKRRRTT